MIHIAAHDDAFGERILSVCNNSPFGISFTQPPRPDLHFLVSLAKNFAAYCPLQVLM
jgi:hypothetical protein